MSKIIMCKGLPASGKSTWAKEMVAQGYKRVNKDDLRAMIDNGKWSKGNEHFVLEMRNFLITHAIKEGHSIIVDDTNLDPSHERDLRAMADELLVEFEIKDFTNVPLDICLARDAKRESPVGRGVILGMYSRYLKKEIQKPVHDSSLKWAIICDLDGTLAIHDGRSPYDTAKCLTDKLNPAVAEILYHFNISNFEIIFCSGREDTYRKLTEEWLVDTANMQLGKLLMRKEGDLRNDAVIKREIYENEIAGKYNVLFVLDDRDRVVDMWRSLGLTCLQVDYGNF